MGESVCPQGERPTYHTFEEVIAYLRYLHSTGTFGRTEFTWRGFEIVHVNHIISYKPGELPHEVGLLIDK